MTIRIRYAELLKAKKLTAYRLAMLSGGRIGPNFAYRLQRDEGAFKEISSKHIEALCDIFDVTPGELFER